MSAPPAGTPADPVSLIRAWLDLAAIGPADAWDGKVACDVIVRLPYAPPGVQAEMRGFEEALAVLGAHWPSKVSFAWHDVAILRTEDPDLFVTTAKSDVMMHSGKPYRNSYVMLTRVRDGLIREHDEYFNPLPIIALLDD